MRVAVPSGASAQLTSKSGRAKLPLCPVPTASECNEAGVQSTRTSRRNSALFSPWTIGDCSLAIRRRRSASDHASPTGGREPGNDSASNTCCSTGKANTVFRFSRIAGICRFYFAQARPASRSASSTWAQIRFWASIPSSRRDAMSIVLTFSNGFAPAGRNDRPESCSGPAARPAEPSAPLGRRTRGGRYPINMASLRDGRARSLPPPQTVKI